MVIKISVWTLKKQIVALESPSVVFYMGDLPGELSEELVTQEKWKKGWTINCDVGEAMEGLENELWCGWSDWKVGEWALLTRRVAHVVWCRSIILAPRSILQFSGRLSMMSGQKKYVCDFLPIYRGSVK